MKAVYTHNGILVEVLFDCPVSTVASRNNFSMSVLESAVAAILERGNVSSNIFNNRPKAITPSVNDFIVASVQGELEDMAGYGRCTLNVATLVKDAYGFKNNKKLSLLQDAVLGYLPISFKVLDDYDAEYAEYEVDDHPSIIGDASDDYGFHARMILFDILIKVL